MSPVLDVLRHVLGERLRSRASFCVALSGGLDSTVLLHGLCALREEYSGFAMRAAHVNHGLHPQANDWAEDCRRRCRELDVPLHLETVEIELGAGKGLEAAARGARYSVFERLVLQDEYVLTAHHQDDQVETVLLRLLRGSGPHGLGGIPADVRFGGGWLCRPFLDLGRQALNEYAESMGLDWLDDPSNTDTNFDRNYLRHEILPLLKKRWPGIGKTIGRAARLSGDAAGMLDALAENDSQGLIEDGALSLAGLRSLSPSRQCNVVRNALIRRGLKAPSELRLKSGLDQLMSAKPDRQPKVCWGRIQVRRYRDRLFFLDFDPSAVSSTFPNRYQWDGRAVLEMGPVRGRLTLVPDTSGSISIPALAEGIVVKFRQGGEQIKKAKNEHHTVLKKLFQQRGILPWMRSHVPLLYVQDRLIAVGDLWVAADAAASQSDQCFRIAWENHPPIQ